VDFIIPANDDAIRSVKLLVGVMANAVCEAKNLPLVDFTSEEEHQQAQERSHQSSTPRPVEVKPVVKAIVETEVVEGAEGDEVSTGEDVVLPLSEEPIK
jgi:small subunit ribosomal protein S2